MITVPKDAKQAVLSPLDLDWRRRRLDALVVLVAPTIQSDRSAATTIATATERHREGNDGLNSLNIASVYAVSYLQPTTRNQASSPWQSTLTTNPGP